MVKAGIGTDLVRDVDSRTGGRLRCFGRHSPRGGD